MADFLDINISIKRIIKKQANRANVSFEDKTIQPETYYRITIATRPAAEIFFGGGGQRKNSTLIYTINSVFYHIVKKNYLFTII
jgi:hypothetical protein